MADKAEKLCACHLKDSIGGLESSVKNICNLLLHVVDVEFRFTGRFRKQSSELEQN